MPSLSTPPPDCPAHVGHFDVQHPLSLTDVVKNYSDPPWGSNFHSPAHKFKISSTFHHISSICFWAQFCIYRMFRPGPRKTHAWPQAANDGWVPPHCRRAGSVGTSDNFCGKPPNSRTIAVEQMNMLTLINTSSLCLHIFHIYIYQ